MGYFANSLHPKEENLGNYFPLGPLDTHVLIRFLWSIFCKWPVIKFTLLTLKIAVHKKTRLIGYFKYHNEFVLAFNVSSGHYH